MKNNGKGMNRREFMRRLGIGGGMETLKGRFLDGSHRGNVETTIIFRINPK